MAKYRQVQTQFWSDSFVIELTPEQKYFFLYLITNEQVKQCGIYEISIRQIVFDTGYNRDTVEKLLSFFQSTGKIKYSKATQEIAIKNFSKHNPQGSPKVKACVNQELKHVKDRVLIGYVYGMDTVSQEEEEEEEEKEREEYKREKESFDSGFSFDSDELKNDSAIDKKPSSHEASAYVENYLQHTNNEESQKVLTQAEKFEKLVLSILDNSSIAHYTPEFRKWWVTLCKSPQWKRKTVVAFDLSLQKLAKFDEPFGVELMKNSISNNWKGVVFKDTDEEYEKYKRSKMAVRKPAHQQYSVGN